MCNLKETLPSVNRRERRKITLIKLHKLRFKNITLNAQQSCKMKCDVSKNQFI